MVRSIKNAIEYEYVAGYRKDSSPDVGVVMDKVGNHTNYGNIGFVDGHVGQFKGKDWIKNANN